MIEAMACVRSKKSDAWTEVQNTATSAGRLSGLSRLVKAVCTSLPM